MDELSDSPEWTPKPWLAFVMGFTMLPFAFLYLNKQRLFWLYSGLLLVAFSLDIAFKTNIETDQWYSGWSFLLLLMFALLFHVLHVVQKYDSTNKRKWYSSFWLASGLFGALCIGLLSIRTFWFEMFEIPASSMSPTLNPGDLALVDKTRFGNARLYNITVSSSPHSYVVKRGDVVVFQYPPSPQFYYVKRVIGLPGDRVTYRDKQLLIGSGCNPNGQNCTSTQKIDMQILDSEHAERILAKETLDKAKYQLLIDPKRHDPVNYYFSQSNMRAGEWLVPEGHYFVMGDNRDDSTDSRYWGFVPADHLIGKVALHW